MQSKISRRTAFKAVLTAAVCLPALDLLPAGAADAALTPLDPSSPIANSLGFVNDTSQVNAAANPTHRPAQRCGTCAQFQGKPGDARGGCNIFVGHSVPENGWCKVWAQKPA